MLGQLNLFFDWIEGERGTPELLKGLFLGALAHNHSNVLNLFYIEKDDSTRMLKTSNNVISYFPFIRVIYKHRVKLRSLVEPGDFFNVFRSWWECCDD